MASKRLKTVLGWSAFWTSFAVLDEWRNHRHDGTTFSQMLRDLFRTNTTTGKIAFLIALTAAAVIFAIHIL